MKVEMYSRKSGFVKMIIITLSIISGWALGQTRHGDHPGVHGMVLLGDKNQYASHLPLFYSPHDYQVIISVKLDPKSSVIYQNDKKEHADEIYTIEPEKFVLPDIVKDKRVFHARIYRGHFERGGTVIIDSARIEISKVLYFQKLSKGFQEKENSHYIVFGDRENQFLAHQIVKRPDFDELLSTEITDKKIGSQLAQGKIALIAEDSEAIKKSNNKNSSLGKIDLKNTKQVYIEFDDLK